MNFAAIDIGSNSVRMLLTLSNPDGQILQKYYRNVTRLAGSLSSDRMMASASMERTLQTLSTYADLINANQPIQIKAVGTAVFRNASNTDSFLANIQEATGIEIEVIDGETEASLSCQGILSVLQPIPQRALLFDLGGGSTEIILYENSDILLQKSLPLGVVRLLDDQPTDELRNEEINRILRSLESEDIWRKWQKETKPIALIGTAGTVTTLAAIRLQLDAYDGELVNNLILDRSWLQNLVNELSGMSLRERLALPGMEEGRADLIVPGLQVVNALMSFTNAESLRVADAGLLEGLFCRYFKRTFI